MTVLSFCVLAVHVHAQDLDQSQKQDLERAKKDVAKAEQAHARDARSSTFVFHLRNARRRVSGLPQGHPEVKALTRRLDAIDPAKPKQEPEKEGTSEDSLKKEKSGEKSKSSPEEKYPVDQIELDMKELKRIEELFNSYKNFEKDEKVLARASKFVQSNEYMAPYKWFRERAAHYEPYVPKNKWRSFSPLQKNLDKQLKSTNYAISGFFTQAKHVIKTRLESSRSYLRAAITLAKSAVARRNYESFQEGWDKKMGKARQSYAELVALVGKDHKNAKELKAELDKGLAEIKEMGRTFKAEVSADRRAKILARLDDIERMGKTLVEKMQVSLLKRLPGKFIAVDEMIEDLMAIVGASDPVIVEIKNRREEVKANVEAMYSDLDQNMADSARAPKDHYTGGDGEKLRQMISAEWKRVYPDDQVLAVRLHAKTWERTVEDRWDEIYKKWERVDKSFLLLAVIVQEDEKNAVIYKAFVNRNNLTGSLNTGVKTKGRLYNPIRMLVKNFE